MGRRWRWWRNEETIRLLQQHCVALAFDVTTGTDTRFLKPEGEIYEFLKSVGAGASNDGVVCTTAGGRLVARLNLDEGIDLRKTIAAWHKLPAEVRRPGAYEVTPEKPAPVSFRSPLRAQHLTPPAGGLVLKSCTRAFALENDTLTYVKTGYGEGAPPVADPFHDFVWLTPDEWRALTPASCKQGDTFQVPPHLRTRLFRWSLSEASGANTWQASEIRSGSLTLTVEETTETHLRLRLAGHALLASSLAARPARRYEAWLVGTIVYDRRSDAITRFDAVAIGPYRDLEARKDYQRDCLLGVSFDLAGTRPQDRVPPRGLAFDKDQEAYYRAR